MSHSKKNGHMFIRASELSSRNKTVVEHKLGVSLSFNHCAFSLQPIKGEAVTTRDGGYVFDILNIMPWIRKHKIHPITGNALDFKDIIRLKIAINDDGKPYCPVSHKIFTDQSYIVAIAKTGNVYAYSAIENLNLTEGHIMHDLLDHTEFTKDDIITLQDPLHPRDIKTIQHEIEQRDKKRKNEDDSILERASEKINLNSATSKVLEEMEKRKKKKIESGQTEIALSSSSLRSEEKSFGVLSSDTKSSSLTSSIMNVRTKSHETEKITEQYWKQKLEQYERIRKEFKSKKSFVSLHTNLGDLNLELYPYLCPQTCDNFLSLCAKGYYNGVKFHRLIKGFMLQGGDPTGTGRGGKSIWGSDFKDEISPKLRHDSIGTLSMANKGPNTNSSQFFITFKETPHLNNKHSVFGKLVGGLKLFQKIETIPVDEEDRPLEDVQIESVTIFYNPFTEDEKKQMEKDEMTRVVSSEDKEKFGNWFSNPSGIEKTAAGSTTASDGSQSSMAKVGKYLNLKSSQNSLVPSSIIPIRKDSTTNSSNNTNGGQFNFDNWK